MMSNIFGAPKLREFYRYKQHAFVDKKQVRPIQAADLLAWQWYKHVIRITNGIIKPRGDLAALSRGKPHYAVHFDAERLQAMITAINTKSGTPIGNEIAGIAMAHPSSSLFPRHQGGSGNAIEYERLKTQYPERFKDDGI